MLNAKHTPGPWRVLGSVTTTPQGADNLHIGHGDTDTFSPMLAEVLSDGSRLPAEANAKLIAAAPELLEACKRAMNIIEAEHEACSMYTAHIDIIEAAINKATQ